MAVFNNNIGTVGSVTQAETITIGTMTFGGRLASHADLRRQIADVRDLLGRTEAVPEAVRAPVAQALDEAEKIPATAPDAKSRIVAKLEGARGLLEGVTGVAKQVAPLIGAMGVVIGAVTGFAA